MRKPLIVLLCLLCACAAGHALDRQPNAQYRARREALAKKAGEIILLFAPLDPQSLLYPFRQDDNFYYLSGLTEPGPALLIAPAREARENSSARSYTEILFLPPHNLRMEKFTGVKLGADNPDSPKITGFDRVQDMSTLADELRKLTGSMRGTIYTDVASDGDSSAGTGPLDFLRRMNVVFSVQDVKPMVAALRMVKDAGETSLLQKAVDASVAAHIAAMKAVKPNVREYEISALMQYEWTRRGCERSAYPPIVGSGHNSTVLHYSDDNKTMKAGDVVVIDAAAEYSMYAADITRTFPVSGRFSARQREIYDIVLAAQQAAIAAFQSGKSLLAGDSDASLTKVAKDYIRAHGKDLHGQPLDQYFIHGVGHYIGLAVHDAGDYNIPLGPGMAFTLEPGIYIPEENLGVRIEDDFLVGPDGKLVNLSAALPGNADDVEKMMAGTEKN
jgi:Xaa-Pro aminopeptidase